MTRGRVVAVLLLLVGLAVAVWLAWPDRVPTVEVEPELREAAERIAARGEGEPELEPLAEPEEVECSLWRTIGDMEELQLEEVDPETLEPVRWLFPERLDGAMRFTPAHPVGLGRLHLRGHESAVISWALGSCLDFVELVEHPKVTVSGRVLGIVETGAVSVSARCGDEGLAFAAPQPPEARFELRVPADAEACVVVVRRVFGGRDLTAEYPLAVRDQEGLEVAVAEAPGVGLGLHEVDDGLRVYGVEPGSGAERAGVQMMDHIVSVDGEPAAELVADELVEEEGPMELEIERDGETLFLRIP